MKKCSGKGSWLRILERKFLRIQRLVNQNILDDVSDQELLQACKMLEDAKKVNIVGNVKTERYSVKLLQLD